MIEQYSFISFCNLKLRTFWLMEGEDSIKGVIIYQWFIQQWDCIVKHWVRKIDMLSLLIAQALENCPWFLLNNTHWLIYKLYKRYKLCIDSFRTPRWENLSMFSMKSLLSLGNWEHYIWKIWHLKWVILNPDRAGWPCQIHLSELIMAFHYQIIFFNGSHS